MFNGQIDAIQYGTHVANATAAPGELSELANLQQNVMHTHDRQDTYIHTSSVVKTALHKRRNMPINTPVRPSVMNTYEVIENDTIYVTP